MKMGFAQQEKVAATAIVVAIVALGGFVGAFIAGKTRQGPKLWKQVKEKYVVEKRATDITRDAYKTRKLPREIDYVVIGSGISGLYLAGLLAKLGQKVVVLEQHYVTGGCTHSFEEHGFEFSSGIHYVGRIEKYKVLLDLVCDEKKVEWARTGTEEDGFCYDEVKLGADEPFKFRAGEGALVRDLSKEFPEDEETIKSYFALAKKVNKSADMYFFSKLFHPVMEWFVQKFLCGSYFKWARTSTESVMGSMFPGKNRLQGILCGQFGNYGVIPSQSPFLIHAGVVSHYLEGGYYPVGGSQEISRCIIPTVQKAGGRVFVKATVKEILVTKAGRAYGVKMADGSIIKAKGGVVSSAGLDVTRALVPEIHRKTLNYDNYLSRVKPGASHVVLFVGFKGSSKDLKLHGANLWHLPVNEKFKYVGPGLDLNEKPRNPEDPWEGYTGKDLLLFIGFPSAKDPKWGERFPGKVACEAITQVPVEWFEHYIDKENPARNQSGKRKNADYAKLKEHIKELMLNRLFELYPQLNRDMIEYCEIGTPLTNQYYLNHAASYGLEHTTTRYGGAMDDIRPETNIRNLFVTGQDVASLGFAGALNSGILTAHAIAKYGFIDLVLCKRNLIEDLMAQENQ